MIATWMTTSVRRVSERMPRPASRIDSGFIEPNTADRVDCRAGTNATPIVTAAVVNRHTPSAIASRASRTSGRPCLESA